MNWKGVGGAERGQAGGCWGGFLSPYKVCPSPQDILFFFFFLSFIHELLTILFSKSVYPNDLSLL